MSTHRQGRRPPRLALYGIVFRIVCSVALRAGEWAPAGSRASIGAPDRGEMRHGTLEKGRSPLPLKLEPGQ